MGMVVVISLPLIFFCILLGGLVLDVSSLEELKADRISAPTLRFTASQLRRPEQQPPLSHLHHTPSLTTWPMFDSVISELKLHPRSNTGFHTRLLLEKFILSVFIDYLYVWNFLILCMGSTLGEKNQSLDLVDPNLAEFDENDVLRVARDHLRCGHKDNGCKLQMKAKR
ncbi:hypothetical protein V6N11_064039 [Hibiscus sabdariffa]|uniref:Uncharacterized protein n=1 Tax=Hibiscus sabdariffa TaxID=183260 RepID=A0ABR2PMH2_9ROSI